MDQSGAKFNRQALLDQARAMIRFVEQAADAGRAAHEVEADLFKRALEMGRQALGLFFGQCGDGDEGEQVRLADGRDCRRLDKLHARPYLSIFGEFELLRVVYGTREGQKIEYVPLDHRLGLAEGKFSYLLNDWNQSLVVDAPFARVDSTLANILGLKQSVHSLERINRKLAEDVSAFWAALPVPPADEEGALMVCSADGKGVPIRGQPESAVMAEPPLKADARSGCKPGRKKVSLVGSVYTVDPFVRTPEAVVDALFRSSGERLPASEGRPRPCFKRVRASLIRDAAETSKPSYDEIFGWIAREVGTRDPIGARPTILLMDGQESLWNAGLSYLPESQLQVTEILDLLHACGYAWDATHLFHPSGSARALRYVKRLVHRILRGEVNAVIRTLRRKGAHAKLRGKRARTLEDVCGYFETHSHRMAYDEYLSAGYPIASGVIEGACRNVVKDRMERSGMRWVLKGAHAMLGVRSIHLSGLWDEFMRFHIDRECQRLYPNRTANDDEMALPLVT
jgi:hypothetical protein